MKATKNCKPWVRRSSARRIVGSCLMTGLLLLGGCAFLDTVTTRTAPLDERTQLGWQDGVQSLHRGKLDDYTCLDGFPLQCESVSGKSLCHCPPHR